MEKSSNNEEVSINPCPPEWLDNEDNALLRGDAIGDTAYTHRWVLKCLFTITEALPKYIKRDKLSEEQVNKTEASENSDDEGNIADKSHENNSDSETCNDSLNEYKVVELDTDAEDAACQLWDMTAEKDVALHLLNLEEVDVLQLATLIFDESCAPRLTEVMVGVVANLCCEGETCDKMLKKEDSDTLLSALRLMGSTSDVPTLCELMRLVRLLLWHRVNRTPNTCWAACPLLKLLCQEYYRNIISFLLQNSLSDTLISNVLELLSNFLFICLPETGLNVASLYSAEEIVNGLLDILQRKCEHIQQHLDDEQEQVLHQVVLCLYAFIDTPGARLIQLAAAKTDSKLETILLSYIEHEGRVECLEDLLGDANDRIIRIIGLSQLLIPTMRLPSLILTVGKLIALIHGETRQYSVSRSQSREDVEYGKDKESIALFALEPSKRKKKRKSLEQTKEKCRTTPVSNPLVEDGGWLSPPAMSPSHFQSNEATPVKNIPAIENDNEANEKLYNKLTIDKDKVNACDEIKSIERRRSTNLELKELKEHLEEFCYHLIAYWWSDSREIGNRQTEAQQVILDVLDQCHAHEVFLILSAIRIKDSSLVPKLQEQILDSGSHHRLVALLAHMYQ